MSQITRGVRAVFSSPSVYNTFQKLMGASPVREELVREFIRPFPGMRLLDVGCGTAEILEFLPAEVTYWGYDISASYIEAAKSRFPGRGHFRCGPLDSAALAGLPRFDVVTALGVLHHLEDDEARGLFTLAAQALETQGRVVTIDPCFAPGQSPIARFLIERDRGQNVRTPESYRKLPSSSFGTIDGQLRHRTWMPYTHWLMECRQ